MLSVPVRKRLGHPFLRQLRRAPPPGPAGSDAFVAPVITRIPAALKVLSPDISLDDRMIERFRNELQLARRISHKDVCRICDLDNCEGTYFITMEYIAGDNLKSIIRMMGRFFWNKRTSEGMKRGLV